MVEVVLTSLVGLIPYLGFPVRLGVVLFGLGALALAISRIYVRSREAAQPPAPELEDA